MRGLFFCVCVCVLFQSAMNSMFRSALLLHFITGKKKQENVNTLYVNPLYEAIIALTFLTVFQHCLPQNVFNF